MPNPDDNNKKCGDPNSADRVFELFNNAATEEKCKEECVARPNCVALSGIEKKWCFGCQVDLEKESPGATAWHKPRKLFANIFLIITAKLSSLRE